jgi:glycosyltransferase involved in cell wall biosynthesis
VGAAETQHVASGHTQVASSVLRVAHVAALTEHGTSGVDKTVLGLVANLEQFGVLPEVWQLSPNHPPVSQRRVGSIEVVDLPAFSRTGSALFGLPAETRRFIGERRDAIDMLHLHSVFIPDNVWVAKVADRPYVLTPHGGYSPQVLRGHHRVAKAVWLRMREKEYVRRASLLHAVSPPEMEQLRSTFGAQPALVFVPNAIDLPAVEVAPERRMHTSPKRVVFLGRLSVAHKGLDLLLGGYARYARRRPDTDAELTLAGPDFRSGRSQLTAMAASLSVDRKVRFLGPQFGRDKDSLLGSAYVFVHTSRWEGMPFAILEALATGCPVLITRATNLAEFVDDFGAGLVVEGTTEGIGDGLTKMLEMRADRYAKMCAAARRLASERFSWSTAAEQMSRQYRSIRV